MNFTSNYNAFRQNAYKKKKTTGDEFTDEFINALDDEHYQQYKDLAPVKKQTQTTKSDIAPVKEEKEDRSWFNKPAAFEDGWQVWDIFKTVEGSARDLGENVMAGILGIGEAAVDAGAYVAGGVGKLFGADEFADKTQEFIAKDLYDEKEVAKKLLDVTQPFSSLWAKSENSVLGEKSDSLAQSGGQLIGTLGLQAAGVPWYVTTGATSFGSAVEEASKEGATFEEAGLSAAISAGAEILSEKLFGGSALGEKGLINLEFFTKGISSKVAKAIAAYGIDVVSEAGEEVFSQVIGNLASYLYNDKTLKEALTDEEAIDGYIESAIGGAVLSGVSNVGKMVSSAKHKTDYYTGLNKNEEAVVEKVYNDRIAEKEQSGEKLSTKDKAKIRAEVMEDLQNGEISIDDIESALGEGVYTEYQNAVSEEENIRKELEDLGNIKKAELTVKQDERYKELKQKLDEIQSADKKTQLKTKLSENVYNLAKGTKLEESYHEQARKGEAYTADVSKYDGKQKETIQKAIDSGILNNSRRTHQFVDIIAKISADKGVAFDFTDNAKLKESGFALNGREVNGFVTKEGVTLNMDSRKAWQTTVGHEITHVLEGTELYGELQKAIKAYAETKGEYQSKRDALAELYKDMDADIDAELTADLVGEYLFTDSDFVNSLSTKHRNVFQKIYDEIKYLLKVVTAGSKEARQLEKVKRAFDNAYKTDSKAEIDTAKYSLIGKTSDGIEVYETSEETMALTWDERKAKYLDVMKNEYRGRTAKFNRNGHTYYAEFDQNSIRKPIYGDSRTSENGKKALIKAGADGDVFDLVENSKYDGSKKNIKDHTNADYFDYFVKTVQIDGKVFDLVADVEKKYGGDGGYVYTLALRDNKKIKASPTHGLDPVHSVGNASEKIIPQNSQKSSDFEKVSEKTDTDIKIMDGGSVTKYSLSTWTPETQTKVRDNLIKAGYGKDRVDKWIKDTNGVASVIAADKDRLDFEAADNQVMLKDNQEYIKTLDASTLCAKRLIYQGTFDAIQHRMPDTMLSSDDLIDLLNMMKEHGVQTPCGVCYVESRRRHLGKFAQDWLDSYNGEYKPHLDEVTTSDGLEALRKDHPQTYKDFVDAMNKKGSSNPKVVQLRTEYRNEIMSLTPAQVKKIEAIGGLRVQSFSDFETPHMLDMMQAVMDMAAKGLHSQAYTKVPNFAWVFGDTGIKINLSLIAEGDGFDADGNLAFSSVEGMDIDEAIKLRDRYSQNVGTIIVGANDKHILACMADDRIDFIIPFHRSGWGMKELQMMGMDSYTDYTTNQKEYDLATGKGLTNLYPPDYWDYTLSGKENAERYLSLCARTGRKPKFSQFLVDNGDGSYSLQPDGSTDGYWKTLIDFKMYDNDGNGAEQQKVQPNFNMDEAYRVLAEYEGGANTLPVANEIVDEFVKKHQSGALYSLSDEDEAPVRGNGRTPLSDMRIETTEDLAPTKKTPDLFETADAEKVTADVAPAKETPKPAEKVKNEQKIAKVLIEEPAKEQKPSRTLSQARNLTVDKHSAIEDLSLKTGNKELMAKADYLHRAENAAQRFINKGADGNKSINDLRKEVEKSGLIQEFSDYMYHALNIDRMSLRDKADAKIAELSEKFGNLKTEQIQAIAAEPITAKTTPKRAQTIKEAREYSNALGVKNKPVFGESVTADMSRTEVKIAENKHPIFKKWADEIYAINNHLKKMMVDSGVISQATSDLFAEMYPHYIPTRRVDKNGNAINVPLDTNKTGVNAPIKRATGGNSDIGKLFNTLAMRAEQTYKAVAKNSLGIELKNTLGVQGTKQTTTVDEINDSFEKSDELLKKGEDGMKPTFTVFENGERIEFEISEDIYDALKPTNEFLAKSIPVLSTLSKLQRGILTQYNLLFSATNAIKDAQSVLINSKHAIKTYKNMPKAALDLASKQLTGTESTYLKEYLEHGGEDTKVFDNTKGEFVKEPDRIQKALGFLPDKISKLNNFIESIPRYAEYIASRESGASIEKAMLDAARVTTNFAAGGDLAKFANRNGFTFLNASIQGASQQARNIREAMAEGKKGVLVLAAKYAVAGLPILLFNHLMWGDDEEYEELSDYVKDNYYIVGKLGDTFVRIPKGREAAVIQNAFEQMKNAITGDDEVDIRRFAELLVENLAPQNPLDNNVIAPLVQTHTNKTWYGEELVPTRLQDLPNAEQYDESTDVLSKWLGETFNLSPYRVNYLLDQVSGGVGDVLLPMMTPKAESGDDSIIGNAIAPWKDKFTTNATINNQNVSDFYDKIDELTKNANSSKATDADTLKYKYMSAINSDLSKLYQQKREIQNSDKSASEKHELSMQIQQQIVDTMRDALSSYENVSIQGSYATVGDLHYRWHVPEEGSKSEPAWQKITDKQLEKQEKVTSSLGISPSEYWGNKEEYDFAYETPGKYKVAKAIGGYDAYKTYSEALNDLEADKDASGKSISGSRKEKVIDYVNNLDADYGTKIILFKSEYKADDTYNYDIIEYLNNREDISYEEMVTILKELGMTVHSNGRVTWD